MAHELAGLLAASPEMTTFKLAEARFLGDDRAQALMQRLNGLRSAVNLLLGDDDTRRELAAELAQVQAELGHNEIYCQYEAAARAVTELVARVNDILTYPLKGQLDSHGCGGCGSRGGAS